MYKKTILANGLRVVTLPMRQRESVAVGIWVNVGGRYESPLVKGAAHFLEHILFKGSRKYSCSEIKEGIEGVGGSLNAFTAEEQTCYYAKIPRRHLRRTADILMDIVFAPTIRPQDVQRERTVILEEIKMYRDLPQYYVMELLDRMVWPGHPLGESLAGTPESVSVMTATKLKAFHRRHYFPANIVISACGGLDHDAFCAQVDKASRRTAAGQSSAFVPAVAFPQPAKFSFERRPIEQMHLAMGFPGVHDVHPDKYVVNLVHIVLGGNMSSRLFHEVREKRGLAYSISTGLKSLSDTGLFLVRAGVDNTKLLDAVRIIMRELRRFKRVGLTAQEFQRAREYYKGQVLLSLEDTLDQMLWVGEDLIARQRIRTLAQVIERIDRIKREDVSRVAKAVLDESRLKIAVVGPLAQDQERELAGMTAAA